MSAASPPSKETPPPEASGSERTVAAADMPVAIGETLAGKYKVEGVLGVGGMGIVVAARHIQLDQKVALKFLLPQAMSSPEAVERFQREARSAVRLRSEHVAKVTDVGVLESGAPYMVMEFLAGADLSHVVAATGAITIDEAVHFVLQACEAIAEAHSLGIIHRDLKPQNLFVTRRVDGKPLIKVLDFGISKTLDSQSGLSLTRTSSIMGSPLYMSPEQMRSSKNVDARSDIWALGVILYELLTGRVPFEAEAIPELCLKVVQDPATPPRSIRAEIPEGLSAVVIKCLEKDPALRFENVADLAAALEPYSHERGSADRIAGTLNIPSRPPMVSISGFGASTNPKVGTGSTAWGTTQNLLARKKRMPFIVGGAVAVAVVGVVVFALGRHSGQAVDDKTTTATSSTVQAQPTTVHAPALTAPPTTFDMPVTSAPVAPITTTQAVAVRPTSSGSHGTVKPAQTSSAKTAAPTVTAPPTKFE